MKKRISKKQIRRMAERSEGDDAIGSIYATSSSEKARKSRDDQKDFSEQSEVFKYEESEESAGLNHLAVEQSQTKFSAISNLYESYVKWDDASESFRQTVSEMLDNIIDKAADMADFVATVFKKHHYKEVKEHHLKKYREHKMRLYAIELKRCYLIKAVEDLMDRGAERIFDNKRRIARTSATVLGVFMAFCVTVNAGTVYHYSYHGEELGTVKDKANIAQATSLVEKDVTANTGKSIDIKADSEDITYKKTFDFSTIISDKKVDSTTEAANKIANCDELEGKGFVIRINGADFAFVDTQATAENILKDVKAKYCTVFDDPAEKIAVVNDEPATSEDVGQDKATASDKAATSVKGMVAERVIAAGKAANTDGVQGKVEVNPAVTRNIILAQLAKKSTLVSVGMEAVDTKTGAIDAISTLEYEYEDNGDYDNAEKYAGIDFSQVDFSSLEGISPDNVSFAEKVEILPVTAKVSQFMDYGDAIKLFLDDEGHSTALTVRTSEIAVYNAPVNYVTVYEKSDDMYEGETKVITPGNNGEKKVVAYITKEDGNEVGNTVLYEEMTKEAVTAVVKIGTKDKPSTDPTGHYIVPTNGHLSSHFGYRWGRLHAGIDLAAPVGTAIYAADGGTVTYAGYNSGGYGNLIKISHGNGVETRYGHCSSINVSVGDKVAQGQLIGKVGNTGRSYGNHCHFEIRINGEAVDPLKYL